MTEELSNFEDKVKGMDWFYTESDDESVYKKGDRLHREIKIEAERLGPEAMLLVNKYEYAAYKGTPKERIYVPTFCPLPVPGCDSYPLGGVLAMTPNNESNNLLNWGGAEEKTTASTTPTEDLGKLFAEAAALKDEINAREAAIEPLSKRLNELRESIRDTMDLINMDSFKGHGYSFFRKTVKSVTTPKNPEDKEQLFNYLKGQDLFDSMVSINSATLNKLYKDLAEAAAKKGNLDFRLPGIAEPKPYVSLEMRKI